MQESKKSICMKILQATVFFLVVFALISLTAFAVDGDTTVSPDTTSEKTEKESSIYGEAIEIWDISATSADNVTATLYSDSENEGYCVLVIDGQGRMLDWDYYNTRPWHTIRNIKRVIVGNAILNVGKNAFAGYSDIEDVVLGNSIEKIGASAFENCQGTTSLILPNTIKTIGSYAFYNWKIDTISMPASSISSIVGSMMSMTDLKEVFITGGESIPQGAFKGFTSLQKVSISDTVTRIANAAFYECQSLETVVMTNSILYIESSAFYGCVNLESIIIPDNVTSIGSDAFANCKSLKSIIIPDNVTSIGSGVFANCKSLKSVNISQNVLYISSDVFAGCESLEYISVDENNSNYKDVDGNLYTKDGKTLLMYALGKNDVEFYIPEGVTEINSAVLSGCVKLEKIHLPESLTSINNTAFNGCISLEEIIVDENNASYKSVNGVLYSKDGKTLIRYPCAKKGATFTVPGEVTRFEYYAFNGTTELSNFAIGDNVSSIGRSCFSNSKSLKSIVLPNSISVIPSYLFSNCTALKSVKIGSGVKEIYDRAFSGCTALETIVIPEGVKTIYEYAFSDCASLKSVYIPQSLTSAGKHAFQNCWGLEAVHIKDIAAWCNIYFAADSGSPLQYAQNLYLNGTLLTEVVIPDSVTQIRSYAFSYCASLTSIKIPSSVITIGGTAISGQSIIIYCDVTEKPTGWASGWNSGRPVVWNCDNNDVADDGCVYKIVDGVLYALKDNVATVVAQPSYLTSANIQEYVEHNTDNYLVKNIVAEAFIRCNKLESVMIPASITSVGSKAFYDCIALKTVYIDSDSIARSLTGSDSLGYLLKNANTVIFSNGVTSVPYFITNNYGFVDVVSYTDVDGIATMYNLYSKHTHAENSELWYDASYSATATSKGFSGQVCVECGVVKGVELPMATIGNITGSSITIGTDLSVNVYATVAGDFDVIAVRFVMNGKETLVNGVFVSSSNSYRFVFEGVAPQCMGDVITAQLLVDGVCVASIENCGIKNYVERLMRCSAEELGMTARAYDAILTLMCDMLEYGAQAQLYREYKTDALVNEGITGQSEFKELTATNKHLIQLEPIDGVGFTAVNLRFENANKLFFKFKTDDVEKTQIIISGAGYNSVYTSEDFENLGNGVYAVYTLDIYATGFDDVYSATIKYDGAMLECVTYSVASYVYSMQNDADETGALTSMAYLARATYSYGKSAKAYYQILRGQ